MIWSYTQWPEIGAERMTSNMKFLSTTEDRVCASHEAISYPAQMHSLGLDIGSGIQEFKMRPHPIPSVFVLEFCRSLCGRRPCLGLFGARLAAINKMLGLSLGANRAETLKAGDALVSALPSKQTRVYESNVSKKSTLSLLWLLMVVDEWRNVVKSPNAGSPQPITSMTVP